MALPELRALIQKATDQFLQDIANQNNFTVFTEDLSKIQINFSLDIPPNGIVYTGPVTRISTSETIENKNDTATAPQIIKLRNEVENIWRTQVTEGFTIENTLEATVSVDFIAKIDTKISTAFKYNLSTEITDESRRLVVWEREIPVIVPGKTRTVITYFIDVGGPFTQDVTINAYITGGLTVALRTYPVVNILEILQRQNPNLKINLINPNQPLEGINIQGTLKISGSLGLDGHTTIENLPLVGNPAQRTIQTLPVQPGPRTLFFS